jgi:EmrB/QacA subfamily drug resistance transporter
LEYKWVALSNTTIGTLMSSLDGNIVLIALPTIARELQGTSMLDLIWILLGYQFVTASVLVNFGRLSDLFGRVKLYNFGFAVFTLGSALCSFSQTSLELIAFRMVQAMGAAFLFSNSAAILTDAFPGNERGKALGMNQISIVVGSVSGLVLGGFLTTSLGWRSIFWINIPIGAFATFWSHYKLKELAKIRAGQQLDVFGNLAFASGLVMVLAAITFRLLGGIDLDLTYMVLGSGISLLVIFYFIEKRVKDPMLNFSLFSIRLFTAGNIAILLNALARGCISLVLTFYLQGPTMRKDALTAGIFLVPMSVSMATLGPISGYLSDKYGARLLSTLGLIVSGAGTLMLTSIGRTITFQQLLPPLALLGAGMGLFASPNRASIMNSVPPENRGIASGTSITLTNVGTTLSLAIAFITMSMSTPMVDIQAIFTGAKVDAFAPWINNYIESMHVVYLVSTMFLLVAIIPSLLRGKQYLE